MQHQAAASTASLGVRFEKAVDMFEYSLQRSSRARHIRITIRRDETVRVTIPMRLPLKMGEDFVKSKTAWIESVLTKLRKHKQPELAIPTATKRDYAQRKEEARALVQAKLEQFNTHYRFHFNAVSIKNTSSRWGSCSKKGNLNFNYRIIYLPKDYADYLIVHELCHLKEFNHGDAFWKLVGETIPEYRELRKKLRVL